MAHSRNNRDSGRVRPKNNPYKRERFNNKNWINQSIAREAKLKNKSEGTEQVFEQAYLDPEDQYLDLYDADEATLEKK